MRPIQHRTSNAVEVCQDTRNGDYRPAVPITRMPDGTVIVFYQPSPEELERLQAGKPVMFMVDKHNGYCLTVEP